MTSINNSLINNSGYYQLSSQSGNLSGNASKSGGLAALLQSGAFSSSPDAQKNTDAFLLDLSPEAQKYLNGSASGSSTDQFSGNSDFLLTNEQRKTITDILTKYKDAPYNQETFNEIQNDLKAAGLDPQLMSMKDKAKSFDPLLVLMNALDDINGNSSSDSSKSTGITSDATEQTKATNYMQDIISQWKNISTTKDDVSAGGVTAVASSSGS